MRELRDLLARLRRLRDEEAPAVMASIVAVEGSAYRREGARLLLEPDGKMTGVLSGGCVERELLAPASAVLAGGRARILRFDLAAEEEAIWGFGLGCAGTITLLLEPIAACGETLESAFAAAIDERRPVRLATRVTLLAGGDAVVERCLGFDSESPQEASTADANGGRETIALVETIAPPVHLVALGAERDLEPLLRLAVELGWQATVVDPRPTPAARERVAPYARYVGAPPRRLADEVRFDARSAALVATHRYLDDLAYLDELVDAPLGYLGVLGPAKRRQRLLADLARQRGDDPERERRLRGPSGLDLGGRSPHEIALAVVAEIQAALHGGSGAPLSPVAARGQREAADRPA